MRQYPRCYWQSWNRQGTLCCDLYRACSGAGLALRTACRDGNGVLVDSVVRAELPECGVAWNNAAVANGQMQHEQKPADTEDDQTCSLN